jgi:hypothetical protein
MRIGFENKKAERKASGNNGVRWVSLAEAARETSYSAEYLGLLARKNKLFARKSEGVWYTTKFALADYVKSQKETRIELNKNLTPALTSSSSFAQEFEEWKKNSILSRRRISVGPHTFDNLSYHLDEFENIPEEIKLPRRNNYFLKPAIVAAALILTVGGWSTFHINNELCTRKDDAEICINKYELDALLTNSSKAVAQGLGSLGPLIIELGERATSTGRR